MSYFAFTSTKEFDKFPLTENERNSFIVSQMSIEISSPSIYMDQVQNP